MVKTMPAEVGPFRLKGDARELRISPNDGSSSEPSGHLVSDTRASYESEGAVLLVTVLKWDSDSAAYSVITNQGRINHQELDASSDQIGTASVRYDHGVTFFKGSTSVGVDDMTQNQPRALEFAALFARTLDNGEGDIPVLVKHLPNWESVERRVSYAVGANDLNAIVDNQPILKEISFDGGTEAVSANYWPAKLVIVEFTTPQFSVENDSRIWTRIAELKSQGQPTPSAYRRVGNYSVFVFNAPDYKTADALISQVKYEQVVQWLGDDPHLYDKLQKYFAQTSAGVLVAVLKSSGLSLVLTFGIGGLLGALLFRYRRAQRAAAFSDAGGSIRLNLDELTGSANSRPLLSAGERAERDNH